jgi:hypothetical protein
MGAAYPKVQPANPSLLQNFGIVLENIDDTKTGLVTCLGFMFQVDTSAWTIDTILYSTNTGFLSSIANGPPVARVVKQDASAGALYVVIAATVGTASTDWSSIGNAGLGPSNFLGTIDSIALRFRTDNIERAILDENGRFGHGTSTPGMFHEVKAHSSGNASGLQTETFYLETDATGFLPAFSVSLSDPMVCQIMISVTGQEQSGANNIASFKRTGLFYRKAGSVLSAGGWSSDFTQKTNNAMNIQYILSLTSVDFNVKPATANNTRWTGFVQVQRLI